MRPMAEIPGAVVAWGRAAQAASGASETALELALAVTGPESGFDPAAVGDGGTSFGLTQLHWGGLGTGYDAATLLDPVRNLAIAMAAIDARLAASGGDAYDALQPWSTREAAWPVYRALAASGVGAGGGGGGGGGGGAATAVVALVVAAVALVLLAR
jgi:hypothetical protein